MPQRIILKADINISDFNEGDQFSKQYKVIKTEDNYLIIGRTFKNGNAKKMSKKYVFAR